MKITGLLHRFEIRADAWIFQGDRPARIRKTLDFLVCFGILLCGAYVLHLFLTAVAYALGSSFTN